MSAASYCFAIYPVPEVAQAMFGRDSSLNADPVHQPIGLTAFEIVAGGRGAEVAPAERGVLLTLQACQLRAPAIVEHAILGDAIPILLLGAIEFESSATCYAVGTIDDELLPPFDSLVFTRFTFFISHNCAAGAQRRNREQ